MKVYFSERGKMKTNLSNKKKYEITKGNPLCLGLFSENNGFRFSVNLNSKINCGLYLWKKNDVITNSYKVSLKIATKILFTKDIRTGNVFSGVISGITIDDCVYCYFCDDTLIPDEYGRGFIGKCICEIPEKSENILISLAYTPKEEFEWEADSSPNIPFENAIIYGIHVKGFTKHVSSQVEFKGTYKGIIEKLDYLKELKITTIEIMPSYEFETDEILKEEERLSAYSYKEKIPSLKEHSIRKNYWGYKKGLYFSPKESYSATTDPQQEFKELVKAIHNKKMEIIMQFFFPDNYDVRTMIDALRFWVMEYHIDGFRLIGATLPKEYLAKDGILSNTKLLFDTLTDEEITKLENSNNKDHIATSEQEFLKNIRGFLKGDENKAMLFLQHMYQKTRIGQTVNRLTDYSGFTLYDLVSYDRKHNKDNGENNKDGTEFNYSWNCGEEGPTRKRKINALRKKQMKNAFCMLFLAQGTPYIRGGDEFAFSQQGNNNPYCQDNEITWLDWSLLNKNMEQVLFVKELIAFRLDHPILHMKKKIRVMDYLGFGYPDVSFHAKEAWRPIIDNVSRHIGIMYCGKYATNEKNMEDNFIYITYNMHWVKHMFALPRLPKGKVWEKIFDTQDVKKKDLSFEIKESQDKNNNEQVLIEPRSVSAFMSKGR